MKKLMLIILMIAALMSVHAERTTNTATAHKWPNESVSQLGTRAPIYLPVINVIYDSETKTVEFECSIECEASVFLYDAYGNLIDMSDTIDNVIYLPEGCGSVLHVQIESDNWYATTYIDI